MTDTQRTATEQLLVSNAIDQAISELDFRQLAGKPTFFDTQFLDGTVDRGYLVSSLRQQLLVSGCVLQEDRAKASYVVEVRSGGIGTDRHALLVGIPQMNVPTFVPGQPSLIPEIPLAKKTDQEGVAKIAVFAYNRLTGKPIWQSGVVKAVSTSKDTWVLGAGPFQQGTIRNGTEFAGEPLPFTHPREEDATEGEGSAPLVPVTQSASWLEVPSPRLDSKWLAYQLTNAPMEERPHVDSKDLLMLTALTGVPELPTLGPWNKSSGQADSTAAGTAKPVAAASTVPQVNAGGQAETEPSKIETSGLGLKAGNQVPTDPNKIWSTSTGFKPDGQ
jgi:hypothetical protein